MSTTEEKDVPATTGAAEEPDVTTTPKVEEKKKKREEDEEDKEDEEDEEVDNSGSNKAHREAASKKKHEEEEVEASPDVHFEPVVTLRQVELVTNEESEEIILKMRAKLFKFDKVSREWKERGTGFVRLLQHKSNLKTRLVMRRDKTLKVCANHYITPEMRLTRNVGSDRSWVWNVAADVSDGRPEAQTLAIRFGNSLNSDEFEKAFLEARKRNEELINGPESADETPA